LIKITYIGMLSTVLEIAEEEVEWNEALKNVATLIDALCDGREEKWAQTLHQENLLISVNQSMVKDGHSLSDGDEVMLLPPMHGG